MTLKAPRDRHESERSLAGWCSVHHVPYSTVKRLKIHPKVVAVAAIIVDLSLGTGAYDATVYENLIRRTAVSDEAIRVYFQLRGKLPTTGRGGGVNVYTGHVDARQQGLVIPVDDAESYRKALQLLGDGGGGERQDRG